MHSAFFPFVILTKRNWQREKVLIQQRLWQKMLIQQRLDAKLESFWCSGQRLSNGNRIPDIKAALHGPLPCIITETFLLQSG